MAEYQYSTEEPIAALATPWGESAIAVIRTSGENVHSLMHGIFEPVKKNMTLDKAKGYTMRYGRIIDPEANEPVDDVMIAVYREPASYTGEDSAEIFCHGSLPVITRILKVLKNAGFRPAQPGEFTLRAFLNGKLDLTRAEAVNELIRSKSDKARSLALDRLSGAVERKITEVKLKLADILSAVEVRIDYPDEDIEGVIAADEQFIFIEKALNMLLATFSAGKLFQEGITAVLAGRTNAGKSTLFNLLLKEERSIVSEYHGTTRDYIEGNISIAGIPIRIFDTAGLRDSTDPVESEGVKRAARVIENAELVLYLVDSTEGVTGEDERFIRHYSRSGRLIKIWNKTDIKSGGNGMESSRAPAGEILTGSRMPPGFIPLSSETGEGLPELIKAVEKIVLAGTSIKSGEPVINSLRQKELLEKTLISVLRFKEGIKRGDPLDVIAVDLQEAVHSLGEITGEVTSQDILNNIFSNFCVGK